MEDVQEVVDRVPPRFMAPFAQGCLTVPYGWLGARPAAKHSEAAGGAADDSTGKVLPLYVKLVTVLQACTKPQFKTLRKVELNYRSWKVVFLMAVTSMRWVSRLTVLSTRNSAQSRRLQ